MLTLGVGTIVMLLLIIGAVCALGGYTFAQARQRRAGGGKSAGELHEELGEYKENVTEHFQTTATLLQEMTEQYRSVYEHMASGAQNLCDQERATEQIENLRAGLLPATIAAPAAAAAAIDEPTEPVVPREEAELGDVAAASLADEGDMSANETAEPLPQAVAGRDEEAPADSNVVDSAASDLSHKDLGDDSESAFASEPSEVLATGADSNGAETAASGGSETFPIEPKGSTTAAKA